MTRDIIRSCFYILVIRLLIITANSTADLYRTDNSTSEINRTANSTATTNGEVESLHNQYYIIFPFTLKVSGNDVTMGIKYAIAMDNPIFHPLFSDSCLVYYINDTNNHNNMRYHNFNEDGPSEHIRGWDISQFVRFKKNPQSTTYEFTTIQLTTIINKFISHAKKAITQNSCSSHDKIANAILDEFRENLNEVDL